MPRAVVLAAVATAVLAAVLAIGACGRRAPIASCDDDLRGVYAGGGQRWMVLDNGPTLEAYALFPDGETTGDLIAAPRVIDLVRAPAGDLRAPGAIDAGTGPGALDFAAPTGEPLGSTPLTGTLHRRYMRRADSCDAQIPLHVTRCAGDTLELVIADPSPPLGFAPCVWPRPAPSRVVRWRRE